MDLVLEKNLEKYTVKYSQVTPHESLKTKLPKFLKLRNFSPPYLRTQNYPPKSLAKAKSEMIYTLPLRKTSNRKIYAFAQSSDIGRLFLDRLQ